ncbi:MULTISPECIES: hypothetical protein [Actinopolyspora]|uniref:Uncharacterized protein n=1 Tax=Actinopolyspora saharensis TaxID=995062 RepID=A0A1H1GWI1_9ACTN|nr:MULTISPECIES: hypothetical protein [Actinopolyspora]NHD17847.1 hypothetical protein [Actinopolyspora sp. BKK2]NHE77720.1 hypothetical protein [Actinopolyspora sp. BKK1]SDR17520.1 hypothetical protein SAMN04489718_3932 [Actinopolyspora saharensis]
MTRASTAGGAMSLVAGILTATALCAVAVFTVVGAGCEDPGSYERRGGVLELVNGCVSREDLPVRAKHEAPSRQDPPHRFDGSGQRSPEVDS